jgi:hypothetical protein
MKKRLLRSMATAILLSSVLVSGNAAVISQHTAFDTFQRTCPGLSDPQYMSNWGDAIAAVRNVSRSAISTQMACHFNGGSQAAYFNNDGSVKEFYDFPSGAAFTPSEVGNLSVTSNQGSDSTVVGSPDNKFYGDVSLDNDDLALPNFKVKSESEVFERNSVNGFAASEYLWTGEDTTLEFIANYDLFVSGGEWEIAGALSSRDYIFNLNLGVSDSLDLSGNTTLPLGYGDNTLIEVFQTEDIALFSNDAENPFEGSLEISFDVTAGDRFFLWGLVQGFGINSGFTNASNTVTTDLFVEGLSHQQSATIFASSLQIAPPALVSGPAIFSLFILSTLSIVGVCKGSKA